MKVLGVSERLEQTGQIKEDVAQAADECGYKVELYHDVFQEYKKFDLLILGQSKELANWAVNLPVRALFSQTYGLPNSFLLDHKGCYQRSSLFYGFPEILTSYMDERHLQWVDKFCHDLIHRGITRRAQEPVSENVKQPFILLLLPRPRDIKVNLDTSYTLSSFVHEVCQYCSEHGYRLAIKPNPNLLSDRATTDRHARNIERNQRVVDRVLGEVTKKYTCATVVSGPIHHFCRKCMLAIDIGSNVAFDCIVNGCVTVQCSPSILSNTGAVVFRRKVRDGIAQALEIRQRTKMRRNQKAVIYHLYHRRLILGQDIHDSELTNVEKICRQIIQKSVQQ